MSQKDEHLNAARSRNRKGGVAFAHAFWVVEHDGGLGAKPGG